MVDLGDSLGGDSRSSFLAALSVPIPLSSGAKSASGGAQLRAFVFLNGGSLGNSSYWKLSSVALNNKRQPVTPEGRIKRDAIKRLHKIVFFSGFVARPYNAFVWLSKSFHRSRVEFVAG